MSGVPVLERRYRRLLTWFPTEHRRVYGEEMIGVLLASAPAGESPPGRAEILDLVGGGLRARLRRVRTGEGNPAWRDALAVFSVVAPVVLLGWLTASYLANIEQQVGGPLSSPRYQEIVSRTNSALLTALIAAGVAVMALVACRASPPAPGLGRRDDQGDRRRGGRARAGRGVPGLRRTGQRVHAVRLAHRGAGGHCPGRIAGARARLAVVVSPRRGRAGLDLGRGDSRLHSLRCPNRVLERHQHRPRHLRRRQRARRRTDAALAGWQPLWRCGSFLAISSSASRRPSTCSPISSTAPGLRSRLSSGWRRLRRSPCSSGWRAGGLAVAADVTHWTLQTDHWQGG